MALLDDLLDFLAAQNLGTKGVDIFATTMPDDPDAIIQVSEYSGRRPEGVLGSPVPIARFPRVQIMVRDSRYVTARARAESVYQLLAPVANQQMGGTRINSIWPLQEPALLENDENGRSIMVFNVEIDRA